MRAIRSSPSVILPTILLTLFLTCWSCRGLPAPQQDQRTIKVRSRKPVPANSGGGARRATCAAVTPSCRSTIDRNYRPHL